MAPSPGGSPPSGVASEPGGDLDDDTLVRAELSGLDMHLSAGQPEPGRSRLQDGVVSQGAEGLLDRSDGASGRVTAPMRVGRSRTAGMRSWLAVTGFGGW